MLCNSIDIFENDLSDQITLYESEGPNHDQWHLHFNKLNFLNII